MVMMRVCVCDAKLDSEMSYSFVNLYNKQQPSEEQGFDVCVGKTAGNIGCGSILEDIEI